MQTIALALTSIMLCAVPGKIGQTSAAITDIPVIADLAYADPKTWHGLPAAGSGALGPEKVVQFSSRPRPF